MCLFTKKKSGRFYYYVFLNNKQYFIYKFQNNKCIYKIQNINIDI